MPKSTSTTLKNTLAPRFMNDPPLVDRRSSRCALMYRLSIYIYRCTDRQGCAAVARQVRCAACPTKKRSTRDERRSAACELLRQVRARDRQGRQGSAREAACSPARSVRDRVRVREPELARDLVFTDRARLRWVVRDRPLPGLREAVLRAGRAVVEVGSEQAAARERQDGASCRAEHGCGLQLRGDRRVDGGRVEAREAAARCRRERLDDHQSGRAEAALAPRD